MQSPGRRGKPKNNAERRLWAFGSDPFERVVDFLESRLYHQGERLDPFRHRPWCERQAERMSLTP